jgi:hypothetical protein
MISFRVFALACALMLVVQPPVANAWGETGHMMISRAAAESLPGSVPAFLRTPEAIMEIARLGPEADNLKDAGTSQDRDADTGHYVDVGDDGTIAGVPLGHLPKTREAYDTALRAGGSNEYTMGYLPYSIVDGFEVVRKDLAYWRADDYLAQHATDAAARAYFAGLRTLRETLTVRDIGWWSHFVGDGSQPLHVTLHFNGWDKYPGSQGLHAKFESEYVNANVDQKAVVAHMKPPVACNCTIEAETARYLAATNLQVIPTYTLFAQGAFASRTDAGVSFTADRLADGADELRDLIVEAWRQSEDGSVGYPLIKVRDIEAGKVMPTRRALGGE